MAQVASEYDHIPSIWDADVWKSEEAQLPNTGRSSRASLKLHGHLKLYFQTMMVEHPSKNKQVLLNLSDWLNELNYWTSGGDVTQCVNIGLSNQSPVLANLDDHLAQDN